jgi:predicted transcriptional regulator
MGILRKPLTFSILLNNIEAEENMAKTITVRVDDNIYSIFKKAAEGQKRTISNYIEYATLNYTINESFVDDEEMNEIIKNGKDLKKGIEDIKAGRYRIIE